MADLRDLLTGDPAKDKMILTMTLAMASQDFIHMQVAPRVGVSKRDGAIGVVKRADKITDTTYRNDNEEAKEIADLNFVEQTYSTRSIDRKKLVTIDMQNHTKYNPDVIRMSYSEAITMQMLLLKENDFISRVSNADKYASTNKVTVGSGDKFTNSSAKPVEYLQEKGNDFKKLTGVKATSLLFSSVSWLKFITHPNVINKLPTTYFQSPKMSDVIQILKFGALSLVDEIIVSESVADSNSKKDSDAVSRDYLMADDVILYKRAEVIYPETNGQLAVVNAGFLLDIQSEDPNDFGTREIVEEKVKGTTLENRMRYDFLNCGSDANYYSYAYLIHDTNA